MFVIEASIDTEQICSKMLQIEKDALILGDSSSPLKRAELFSIIVVNHSEDEAITHT